MADVGAAFVVPGEAARAGPVIPSGAESHESPLFAILLLATIATVTSNDASAEATDAPATTSKASALASAASLSRETTPAEATVLPADARALAARISEAEIPLPPGLNSAAGLDWTRMSQGFGGGGLSKDQIRHVLQSNAVRDWLWYATHNDLTSGQRKLILGIPEWSAFRDTNKANFWKSAIEEILGADRATGAKLVSERYFRGEDAGKPTARTAW